MPTPTQQEEYLLRYANYRVEQDGVDGFGFFWDEYNKTTPAYWTRQILLEDDWINHSYFAYDNSNGFTPIQNFGTGRKADETNNYFYVAQGILRGDITSVDSTHYRVNVNNITYIPNVYYEYLTSSPSNYTYADAFSIVYSSSEYKRIYSGYPRNYTPPTSFEQTYSSREEALQNLVTIFHNIEIWVDGERWAHARVYTSGGGAGSGYIGNSLLSNKKMVGYNVPTSSAEGTKTESVNEASATPVSGKPKSGNGFVRIKFLRDIDFFGFIEHMNESQADNRFEYIGANAGYSRISPDYTSHEIDFGDWANFPIFAKNKPYMVKTDGTADYQLSENDYTKKADGVTASDVSNTSYAGCGAFAWLPKIYQKQEISGNDRIVKFSFTKKDGFEAVGFKTRDSGQIQELEGVWIPMFYGSKQGPKLMSINNSEKPTYGITIGAFKDAIDAVSSRARFFGGAIRNVITDLLTMFARDADIQGYYGFGCMNTSASSWYPETTMPQNAVKGGGRFYTSHTGTELCKVFHSILNSQVLWQYDPYYKIVNGNFWVSPYYEYGVGNESNIIAPSATGYRRAKKYGLIDDYGQVPAECEDTRVYDVQPYYLYIANSGSDRYSVRGGNYSTRRRGFQTVTFDSNYSYTTWDRSASPMILPPVGYKPD